MRGPPPDHWRICSSAPQRAGRRDVGPCRLPGWGALAVGSQGEEGGGGQASSRESGRRSRGLGLSGAQRGCHPASVPVAQLGQGPGIAHTGASRPLRIFLSVHPVQHSGRAFTKKLLVVSLRLEWNCASRTSSVHRLADSHRARPGHSHRQPMTPCPHSGLPEASQSRDITWAFRQREVRGWRACPRWGCNS